MYNIFSNCHIHVHYQLYIKTAGCIFSIPVLCITCTCISIAVRGGPFDIWGGGGVEENMEINKIFPILLKINKIFPSLLEINKLFLILPEKNELFHPKNNFFVGLIP